MSASSTTSFRSVALKPGNNPVRTLFLPSPAICGNLSAAGKLLGSSRMRAVVRGAGWVAGPVLEGGRVSLQLHLPAVWIRDTAHRLRQVDLEHLPNFSLMTYQLL